MAKNKEKDVNWLELCRYLEVEFFNYSKPGQAFQKKACLLLQGLAKGQDIVNSKLEKHGEYSYKVILLTFKANKAKILNAIKGKTFTSEANKMAYICAIVRDNLNFVAMKYEASLKSEDKIENINTDVITHDGAEYKAKTPKSKKADKFGGLW